MNQCEPTLCFLSLPFLPKLGHPSPSLYSSSHRGRKRENQRIYQQKAVESRSVGGREHVEDQTMLSHYSMIALCLPSTASILPLHSLNLCVPSVSPTPQSFFFFSYIFSQPWRLYTQPEFPCNPHHRSNSNNISSSTGLNQQNSFKCRKSSLALECRNEEGGTLTHAYRTVFIWPA